MFSNDNKQILFMRINYCERRYFFITTLTQQKFSNYNHNINCFSFKTQKN